MLFALLAACGHVDPAPQDLDGLAHWFWSGYGTAEDTEIGVAVENFHAAVDPDGLTEPRTGGLTDMTAEEQATVSLEEEQDPSAATGMYVLDVLPCTLDQAERIAYHLDQNTLYEGVYDSYERTYTSDFDAYTSRQTPFLTWASTIEATVLGNTYVEDVDAGLRWSAQAEDAPFGPVLLARAWLVRPGEFENEAASFSQDYQLEIFYEQSPGSLVHGWFLWRQMDYGAGLDTDNEDIVALMLSKLVEWDEQTAAICAEGGP